MSDIVRRIWDLSPEKRALLKKLLVQKTGDKLLAFSEPIAIVGMGCRFPAAYAGASDQRGRPLHNFVRAFP